MLEESHADDEAVEVGAWRGRSGHRGSVEVALPDMDRTPQQTPEDVIDYYARGAEFSRLESDEGVLEALRTKELLGRFITGQRIKILDVGGGVGVYASWLAELGHHLHLVDPVLVHLEKARRRAGDPPRFEVSQADARSLRFEDDLFDAVLVMGPLYHLHERGDRILAASEAHRVCRSGGTVIATAISRYGPMLNGLRDGWITQPDSFERLQRGLEDGVRPPQPQGASFPQSHYHLADELEEELHEGGLGVTEVLGIEGPGWLYPNFKQMWTDRVMRERILWAARALESNPFMKHVSAHLMAIAQKP